DGTHPVSKLNWMGRASTFEKLIAPVPQESGWLGHGVARTSYASARVGAMAARAAASARGAARGRAKRRAKRERIVRTLIIASQGRRAPGFLALPSLLAAVAGRRCWPPARALWSARDNHARHLCQ